jgi:glycosyltransferase involved in cell wall biosynthesis
MRIVYVSQSTIPSRAANSIHVIKMCHALAANGHAVTLLVPDKRDDRERGVVDIFGFYGVSPSFEILHHPWAPFKGRGFLFGWMAARRAKRMRPDLVYGRDLPACYWSALMGLPVIFESHSPIEGQGIASKWLFSRLIRHSKLRDLVVITEALKEHYVSQWGSLAGRAKVLPDGADPICLDLPAAMLSGRLGHLQIGYVGHLYRGRGIDLIIALARRLPQMDFHLVGGAERDIEYWMREAKGVLNITFHGFVPPSSADSYRLAVDVLIAPYEADVSISGPGKRNTAPWMSPLKVFEYMAAGKAIVASDLASLREVLRHGENALLCPPGDLEAWFATLKSLEHSPEKRQILGSTARFDLERCYSWAARARSAVQSEYGRVKAA